MIVSLELSAYYGGSRTILLLTALVLLCLGIGTVSAQEQKRFSRGLILEDPKVYKTFPIVPRYRAYLPSEVDFSKYFPVPGSQGRQSSCTAWAVGYSLRTYYQMRIHHSDVKKLSNRFSPAFIYNSLVKGDCDIGTRIPDALNFLKNEGIATLGEFPYDPDSCTRLPDAQTIRSASAFRILGWEALDVKRLDDLKGQLARGHPVVVAMTMPDSFERFIGRSTFNATDQPRDAHAMVLTGYSDSKAAFKLINSWGIDWGDAGFAWVSYDAMQRYLSQAYVADPGASIPDDPLPPVIEKNPPKPEPIVAVVIPPKPVVEPKPPPVIRRDEVDGLVVVPTPNPAPPLVKPNPVPVPNPQPNVVPQSILTKIKPQPVPRIQIAKEVRRILAQSKCAQLSAKVSPIDEVFVSGFVGERGEKENLARLIGGKSGTKVSVEDVKVFPWPQCEALITFRAPIEKNRGLAVRTQNKSSLLQEGELLSFEVTTPDFPSYIYVTYLNADGEAIHLYSPGGLMPKQLPPGRKIVIGNGNDGTRFRVSAPFGDEMVVVIASASPLFSSKSERPKSETEREYLTAFRSAFLAKSLAGHSNRIVSAAYATLRTESR